MDGQWHVGKYREREAVETSYSLEVSVCIKGGAFSFLIGTEGFKRSRLRGFTHGITGGNWALNVFSKTHGLGKQTIHCRTRPCP